MCHDYLAGNSSAIVTKVKFNRLFSQAWIEAIKLENIISGFHTTGVCPLDSEAIKIERLAYI